MLAEAGALPGPLTRLAGRIEGLAGWRRWALAATAGAALALAQAPVHALPAVLAFTLLLWQLGGCGSGRRSFLLGWVFGFGYFVAGLYWISNALLVDGLRFAWLIPFAAAGLPAVLAIYVGLATAILHRLRLAGIARPLAFAALWSAMEWLRGVLFTGFPWNLTAYVWGFDTVPMQAVALIGSHGLGLLTVIAAALPAALAGRHADTPARAAVALGASLSLLAALAAWGGWRLAGAPVETVPGVQLRIVQGNVSQADKWHPELRLRHLDRYVALSRAPAAQPPTHVIWPETAVAFLVTEQATGLLERVGRAAPPGGLVLAGAPRLAGGPGGATFHNSLLAIDGEGRIVETYDKAHLVPFGEYVPFRRIFPIVAIAAGETEFSPGPARRTLRLAGLPPVAPLICYEVIFPGAVASREDRPAWLLNLTNDGWYGNSAGPYQHFESARFRAVEEGLPLVRAANTGVSGVVDPFGRVVGRLGYGETGILDRALPRATAAPTPYARLGDLVPALLLAATAVAALAFRRQQYTFG